MVKRLGLFVLILSLCLGLIAVVRVQAAGCSVDSFSATPGGSVTVGDIVTFYRNAHCDGVGLRAIRQTFNGNPWGEYGGPSDTRTWNTGAEYGAGNYHICLQVAESGNDSWSGVAQSCFDYTVNPKNQQGQIPQCTISVNPSSNLVVAANTPVGISANGSCSTGVRAMRVLLNDQPQYELGSSSINWTWNGSGPSNTLWRVCAQVAGQGDDSWSYKAESCFTIQVEDQGHPVEPIAPPVSNGGTTANSGGFSQYRLGANGLDVQGYCGGKFGVPATNDGVTAVSWDCAGHRIDHDQVCRDIWGDSRPYAWLQGGLAGWTCEQSPQPGGNSGSSQSSGSTGGSNSNQGSVQDLSGYGSAPAGQWVKVVTGKINMRSGPGVNYDVKAKFPYGSYLDYKSTSNGWYEASYNGVTGWVSGGTAFTQRGSGPDNGAQVPVNPAPSSDSVCSLPIRLQIGGIGRSTYSGTDLLNLRSGAGTSYSILDKLKDGDQFSVSDGPYCAEDMNWWHVMFNGTPGYLAEGGGNTYYTETVSFPPAVTNNSNIVDVQYYYGVFNSTYDFQVDVSDKANCVILNGSAIVAQEINRSYAYFNQLYSKELLINADLELARYLKNDGDIDTFRVNVDTQLLTKAGCSHSYYKLGNSTMDLYGLGNIMFGYYSIAVYEIVARAIGHAFQLVEDHRLDFPDDQSQIILGRAIAKSGLAASAGLVEQLIPSDFVNGK